MVIHLPYALAKHIATILTHLLVAWGGAAYTSKGGERDISDKGPPPPLMEFIFSKGGTLI